jgi:hypothetical protein
VQIKEYWRVGVIPKCVSARPIWVSPIWAPNIWAQRVSPTRVHVQLVLIFPYRHE